MTLSKISCTVGLPAYNEAENIGNLLKVLLAQKLRTVSLAQIIVVASGCTDGTEDIVREYMERDSRIELIVQPQRRGKASAVNIIIEQNQSDVIVLHSTDVLPADDVVEKLVSPFTDPDVGITGGRPVPTNDPNDFVGYIVHILWQLHHEISKRSPKMGEVIAFRPVLRRIPEDTPVDEASIEPLIIGQGYKLRYIADAKVYNHGPTTIADFLKQRRRIYTGHLYLQGLVGYRVATMSPPKLATVFLQRMFADLPHLPQYIAAAFLEVYGRVLGWYDWKIRKARPYIWSIAETTKVRIEAPSAEQAAAPGEPVT
jgi:biofilm PGA synthesis N-glycosyltransferase PgaC